MTIPESAVWICAPIFLLGCYDIIAMIADWWHRRTKRRPR